MSVHHFYRLLGDVDGDEIVDANDLNEIAASINETSPGRLDAALRRRHRRRHRDRTRSDAGDTIEGPETGVRTLAGMMRPHLTVTAPGSSGYMGMVTIGALAVPEPASIASGLAAALCGAGLLGAKRPRKRLTGHNRGRNGTNRQIHQLRCSGLPDGFSCASCSLAGSPEPALESSSGELVFKYFGNLLHRFSRARRQVVFKYGFCPCQKQPAVRSFQNGPEIQPLKQFFGDRPLGVAETRSSRSSPA